MMMSINQMSEVIGAMEQDRPAAHLSFYAGPSILFLPPMLQDSLPMLNFPCVCPGSTAYVLVSNHGCQIIVQNIKHVGDAHSDHDQHHSAHAARVCQHL